MRRALIALMAAAAADGHARHQTSQTIWPAAWPGSVSGSDRLAAAGRCLAQLPPARELDCDGLHQCQGWGTIPATLAEYDLGAYDHLDFYDVSMVDGSNLPMYINTVGGTTPGRISDRGCEAGHGCTTAVHCPPALRVRHAGRTVACISPCVRFKTDRYCCAGAFASGCSPATGGCGYRITFGLTPSG